MTPGSQQETVIQIGEHEIPAKYADTVLEQARGHMFRTSTPDYALVFPHDSTGLRSLHMLFVPFSLDALYVIDGEVEKVSTIKPMIGFSLGKADTIIELPAQEYDISEGDEVRQNITETTDSDQHSKQNQHDYQPIDHNDDRLEQPS